MIYRVAALGAVSTLILFFPVAAITGVLRQVVGREFSIAQWRSSLGFLFLLFRVGGFVYLILIGAGVSAAIFALARYISGPIASRPRWAYAIAVLSGFGIALAVSFAVFFTSDQSWPTAGP